MPLGRCRVEGEEALHDALYGSYVSVVAREV
jgi:hypothetical protein